MHVAHWHLQPSTWDAATWSALASWVTLAAVIISLLFARNQVKLARQAREDQIRPFVIVDVQKSAAAGEWITELVVENVGRTVARNVLVTFEPPLASTMDKEGGRNLADTALARGIDTFPPGRKWTTTFDAMNTRYNRDDLPRKYNVTVKASGERGAGPYIDHYVIDLDLFYKRTYLGEKTQQDGVKALEDIAGRLKSWSYHFSGLRVYAKDADRAEAREAAAIEEMRRAAEPDDPSTGPT